jgi:hypothetical protein
MTKKEQAKLNDTRHVVETAIDMSKDGVRVTWERRIRGTEEPIRRWKETKSEQTAAQRR